jgi:2-polyprenyl-3-methyl-5-hydroxy-6-metoxy-1,4-benzoquinol methylase
MKYINELVNLFKRIRSNKSIQNSSQPDKITEKSQHIQTSRCLDNPVRQTIAQTYLKGKGIEIGALHNPLKLPQSVNVIYLDKYSIQELKKHNLSFNFDECVNVDIFDDGEKLESIKDSSMDFVIANHFMEHCENPIKTFENMIRIIKSNGILFLTIPDKRFIFDKDRPITPLEHILKDYHEGPHNSKRAHYEEWVKYLGSSANLSGIHYDNISDEVNYLMKLEYSIHYHVWTQTEILEYILLLKKMLNTFEVELFLKNISEIIIVLRKCQV